MTDDADSEEYPARPPRGGHPMQPIYIDEHGVARFKANMIVEHLIDSHPTEDMNTLAASCLFSTEDREQFAQLIGYSVSGAGDLSYVSEELANEAQTEVERLRAKTPEDASVALRNQLWALMLKFEAAGITGVPMERLTEAWVSLALVPPKPAAGP